MSKFGMGPQIDHAIIETLKPVVKAILQRYDEQTPELTELNTTHSKNTRALILIMDWFLEHIDKNVLGVGMFNTLRGLMKFAIIHYDYDAPYRRWGNVLLKHWLMFYSKDWEFDGQDPFYWKDEDDV